MPLTHITSIGSILYKDCLFICMGCRHTTVEALQKPFRLDYVRHVDSYGLLKDRTRYVSNLVPDSHLTVGENLKKKQCLSLHLLLQPLIAHAFCMGCRHTTVEALHKPFKLDYIRHVDCYGLLEDKTRYVSNLVPISILKVVEKFQRK